MALEWGKFRNLLLIWEKTYFFLTIALNQFLFCFLHFSRLYCHWSEYPAIKRWFIEWFYTFPLALNFIFMNIGVQVHTVLQFEYRMLFWHCFHKSFSKSFTLNIQFCSSFGWHWTISTTTISNETKIHWLLNTVSCYDDRWTNKKIRQIQRILFSCVCIKL